MNFQTEHRIKIPSSSILTVWEFSEKTFVKKCEGYEIAVWIKDLPSINPGALCILVGADKIADVQKLSPGILNFLSLIETSVEYLSHKEWAGYEIVLCTEGYTVIRNKEGEEHQIGHDGMSW